MATLKSSANPTARALLAWYDRHHRELPWRTTPAMAAKGLRSDPYHVWLSEVMLQQTTVQAVKAYFEKFVRRWPTVDDLAAAPNEEVMAAWAGLGYYARARNLRRCAQEVMARHGGLFPDSAEELAQLPGIGRSTAAAIAAFAWGRNAAILDGNVKRVLCRHFGIDAPPGMATDRSLWALAEALLPATDMEPYTQGLMDLGATICTGSRPDCNNCPLQATCVAWQEGRQAELPVARQRPPLPERQTTLVFFSDGHRLLLERRSPVGIWGGLLSPLEGEPEAVAASLGLAIEDCRELPGLRHSFTHFRLHIRSSLCRVAPPPALARSGALVWLDFADAATAGVPAPVRKLIRQIASATD